MPQAYDFTTPGLLLANLLTYGILAFQLLRRRRKRLAKVLTISDAFVALGPALKAAVPDLPAGYTWREGIDIARSELGINISEVGFVWEPWSVRVAGYNVTASTLGSADRVDVSNGTVYMVGKGDEARIGYRVGLGNSTFAQSSLSVPPFTFPQVHLNIFQAGHLVRRPRGPRKRG